MSIEAAPAFGGGDAWFDEGELGGDEEEQVSPVTPPRRMAKPWEQDDDEEDDADMKAPAAVEAPSEEEEEANGVAAEVAAVEAAEARWHSVEALATEVIAKAKSEVEAEAADAYVPFEDGTAPPPSPGGGSGRNEAALDWAAGMERDALESAAMRHGLDAEDGEDAATGDSPTQVDVTMWREIARVEAQSLLKLNEEGSRIEAAWQSERSQFLQLKSEVQEEMRREARQGFKARAIGGGDGSPGGGDGEVEMLRSELADSQSKLRRAQAKARNLRRERSALETELERRQAAVLEMEMRIQRLKEAL